MGFLKNIVKAIAVNIVSDKKNRWQLSDNIINETDLCIITEIQNEWIKAESLVNPGRIYHASQKNLRGMNFRKV